MIAVLQGWSVLVVCGMVSLVTIIWMAHLAVHTQAKLAAEGDRDPIVDAFVWINRQLTGKPPRKPRPTVTPPPQT